MKLFSKHIIFLFFRTLLFLFFPFASFLFLPFASFAQQQLPVRTITNVSAPYPVSLEQFVAVDNNKISLTIIPNDIKLQNYPIKLKLVISGGWFTISTNPAFIHRDIKVNNGEIQTFTGADLAEWFNPDNLLFDGYSKSQYVKSGRLPEGLYQVWFEIYETNYGYNMSSSTKAMVWVFENDPPLLNFPLNAKEFTAIDPQNIVFNWTLRQTPFSVAGATNEYKVELWEVWPDNINVEEAVRTTRPVYSGTVNSGTFNYTAAEPLLLPGRKYAWRVQAFDPEGKKQYKNDGYSEVRWFRFGKDCGVPSPALDKITDNSIALKWENDYRFDKYELRWRNKNRQDAKWYTLDGDRQGVVITKLEPNTQYEIQVHGYCGIQDGEYSPSLTARTKQEIVSTCGVPAGNADLSSQVPLPTMKPGDYFRASDFDVQVYQVSGANGTFTGKGFVSVPLLKSIKFEAEFRNVKVNTDYRLYDGEVKFIYNPNNGVTINLTKLLDALKPAPPVITGTNPYTDIANRKAKVDTTITTITVSSSGEIIAEKADGRKEVIRAATDEMVAISGKTEASEQYVVDTKTGTLYKGTPDNGSSGKTQPSSTNTPVKYEVFFAPHENQIYGLDIPGEKSPAAEYDKNTIGGSEQNIGWKSVETGHMDRLLAKVKGGSIDSVHYVTESENMVVTAPGKDKNTSQLLVTGVEKKDGLKAWYPEKVNDSTENRILAAQVNIVAYDKQTATVCLVEVNGAISPNAEFIERELNAIYSPAVVQWKVNRLQGFKVTIEGLTDGKFVNKRPDDKMDYTDHEKQVRDAFIKTKDYDKSTVYLFFIGNKTTHPIDGFMPFNRQFGFIFCENTSASSISRTIAHELGHGAFRLQHPYEATDPRMAADNNLMAYSQSSRLYKSQWDECHDKDWGVNWFEDGEDGESYLYRNVLENIKEFKNTSNNSYTFLTPAGKIITIPSEELTFVRFYDDCIHENHESDQAFLIPTGTLAEFDINGVKYSAVAENDAFFGYRNRDKKEDYYKDIYSKSVKADERKVIVSFPCFDGICDKKDLKNEKVSIQLKANIVSLNSDFKEWPSGDVSYGLESQTMNVSNTIINNIENYPKESILLSNFSHSFNEAALKFLASNINCYYSPYNSELFRIANFINNDKLGVYESFVSCNNWFYNPQLRECFHKIVESELCPDCPLIVIGEDSQEEYYKRIPHYYQELVDFKNKNTNINKEIEDWNKGSNELISFLAKNLCSNKNFEALTLAARKKILSVIGQKDVITGAWFLGDERKNAEGQIINVLKYAKENEYKDLINLLKGNKYELFFKFYNNIDNTGPINSNNFDEFVKVLTKIAVTNDLQENPQDLVERNNVFEYNNSFRPQNVGYKSRYFKYALLEDKQKVSIYTWTFDFGNSESDSRAKTEFDPFETVVIIAKDEYSYPEGGIQYKKGDIWIVPAFAYPAMVRSKNNKLLSTNIKFGANFLLIGCSLGSGLAAEAPLLAFLNFTDAVALTYSWSATEGTLLEELEKSGSDLAPIAKAANTFCNIYLVYRGASAISGLIKSSAQQLAGVSEAQLAKLLKTNPILYEKLKPIIDASKTYLKSTGVQGVVVTAKNIKSEIDALKAKLGLKSSIAYNFSEFNFKAKDKYIDVVIHYKNNKFVVSKEILTGDKSVIVETEMSMDELASIVNNTNSGKAVRLLSCNDLDAAIELSKRTSKPFYASDGWVDLYKDGTIYSENSFYKFKGGEKLEEIKFKSSSSSQKIRLGESVDGAKTGNLAEAGTSKFGQRLDEIGEVLEDGLVKGKYSQRTFNPNNVGGAIQKLDWSTAKIERSGIDKIKKHLSRLENDPWNDAMLKRLDEIESGKVSATDFDKRFYTHELTELERAQKAGFSDTHTLSYEEWNDLHSATLEDFSINEIIDYNSSKVRSLYHPDIQK